MKTVLRSLLPTIVLAGVLFAAAAMPSSAAAQGGIPVHDSGSYAQILLTVGHLLDIYNRQNLELTEALRLTRSIVGCAAPPCNLGLGTLHQTPELRRIRRSLPRAMRDLNRLESLASDPNLGRSLALYRDLTDRYGLHAVRTGLIQRRDARMHDLRPVRHGRNDLLAGLDFVRLGQRWGRDLRPLPPRLGQRALRGIEHRVRPEHRIALRPRRLGRLACGRLGRLDRLRDPFPHHDRNPMLALADLAADPLRLFIGQPARGAARHEQEPQIDAPVRFGRHQITRPSLLRVPRSLPGNHALR